MSEIVQVCNSHDLEITKTLFLEYQQELGVDLCFQEFEEELNTLPGEYTQPNGRLFLIKEKNEVAGCIAFKPVSNNCCEMKRLYVRRQFRGHNFGRLLATKLIDAAREAGYSTMRLDTLSSLVVAISLYQGLGFVASEPTYQHDELDLTFMTLDLVGGPGKN
jgi:GNAT superfamily N-acetyltransferase